MKLPVYFILIFNISGKSMKQKLLEIAKVLVQRGGYRGSAKRTEFLASPGVSLAPPGALLRGCYKQFSPPTPERQ